MVKPIDHICTSLPLINPIKHDEIVQISAIKDTKQNPPKQGDNYV